MQKKLLLVYEWLDLHKGELMANWTRIEKEETLEEIKHLE